jgi:hypothetical protein
MTVVVSLTQGAAVLGIVVVKAGGDELALGERVMICNRRGCGATRDCALVPIALQYREPEQFSVR